MLRKTSLKFLIYFMQIYEYCIQAAQKTRRLQEVSEEELLLLSESTNKTGGTSEPKSRLEILAEERNLKRRRQSYKGKKVHSGKKSHLEVLREVISNQMDILQVSKCVSKSCKLKWLKDIYNLLFKHVSGEILFLNQYCLTLQELWEAEQQEKDTLEFKNNPRDERLHDNSQTASRNSKRSQQTRSCSRERSRPHAESRSYSKSRSRSRSKSSSRSRSRSKRDYRSRRKGKRSRSRESYDRRHKKKKKHKRKD